MKVKVLVAQSFLTLCDPMDCSPSGSFIHGILQATLAAAAAAAKYASVMSDSVRPHRWQPTRLLRPWDSPGKNTGVGCHFLLQCMKVKSESEVAQSWSGLLFPSPGNLLDKAIKPMSSELQAGSLPSESPGRSLKWMGLDLK